MFFSCDASCLHVLRIFWRLFFFFNPKNPLCFWYWYHVYCIIRGDTPATADEFDWPVEVTALSVVCAFSPRDENSLLASHAWLTQIHHNSSDSPVSAIHCVCLCASVRVGVCECGRWGSDGLKVTYDSWRGQGLMATIGELFYKGCGWIKRTSFSHCASIHLPSDITFSCIRSFHVWCNL